jgi:hypothetical protein
LTRKLSVSCAFFVRRFTEVLKQIWRSISKRNTQEIMNQCWSILQSQTFYGSDFLDQRFTRLKHRNTYRTGGTTKEVWLFRTDVYHFWYFDIQSRTSRTARLVFSNSKGDLIFFKTMQDANQSCRDGSGGKWWHHINSRLL